MRQAGFRSSVNITCCVREILSFPSQSVYNVLPNMSLFIELIKCQLKVGKTSAAIQKLAMLLEFSFDVAKRLHRKPARWDTRKDYFNIGLPSCNIEVPNYHYL